MSPLLMSLVLVAVQLPSKAADDAPDALAPLPTPPSLVDPDDETVPPPAEATPEIIDPPSTTTGVDDAVAADGPVDALRATFVGEGDGSGDVLLTLIGGGLGAAAMSVALVGLGVIFFGSIFAGGGIGAVIAFFCIPLAFAILPLTAGAARLVPRILGQKTGREFFDAGLTFGLSLAGTFLGGTLGAVGSVFIGAVVGTAWVYSMRQDLSGLFDPSTSFDALYPMMATAVVLPIGTLLGAATLGIAGAALSSSTSLFVDDAE